MTSLPARKTTLPHGSDPSAVRTRADSATDWPCSERVGLTAIVVVVASPV
ncbi:hypothetical protein [Micromonospora sp. NPDC051006]